MRIKFVDKNGSLEVVNVEDDADFSVKESADGTFYIQVFKSPHTNQSGKLYQKEVALSSDKVTADKCIERIYDQLNAKKDFCDLSEVQLGTSDDKAETAENDNE